MRKLNKTHLGNTSAHERAARNFRQFVGARKSRGGACIDTSRHLLDRIVRCHLRLFCSIEIFGPRHRRRTEPRARPPAAAGARPPPPAPAARETNILISAGSGDAARFDLRPANTTSSFRPRRISRIIYEIVPPRRGPRFILFR
ncbi:hypothetical protein EVAR_47649_1 [Eumeta japonica]|uniref:Uncharacterized protein n=1 Tax=Eumeta variegata TaxID=151549 RepID=A0A4C1Y2N1_EUMVA|nr:hypothetical protein EVAR_47649_1 [Eumeta japonica]